MGFAAAAMLTLTGAVPAHASPEESRLLSFGLPVGVYLSSGEDGGFTLGPSIAYVARSLRVDAEVGAIENPVESGVTLRAHGGFQHRGNGWLEPFATVGYRHVTLDNNCRETCDEFSSHEVSARLGFVMGNPGLRSAIIIELGIPLTSVEIREQDRNRSGPGGVSFGLFLDVGFSLANGTRRE